MTATSEKKCRCGLVMRRTPGGGGMRCENCDIVQTQQPFGIARRKTAQDIRFEMSWLREINETYKDNTTKPEVGTANTEDEGDTDEG